MTDYSKPFPCGDCGKMVIVDERHTFKDCRKWGRKIRKEYKERKRLKKNGIE